MLRLLKRPMVAAFLAWKRMLCASPATSPLDSDVLYKDGAAGGEGGSAGAGGDAVAVRLDNIDDRIEGLDNKMTAVMLSIKSIEEALRASPRPAAFPAADLEKAGGGVGGR